MIIVSLQVLETQDGSDGKNQRSNKIKDFYMLQVGILLHKQLSWHIQGCAFK